MKRFDRDAVAVMLEALAGKTAPDAIVGAVFDETEGNPFFVEEVFWHLVEERKIFDDSGEFRTDIDVDELDVPESVRLVVGRRLERLGPDAQKVLAAGAVVGRGFPFALLEAITADTDAERLLDIVEEAEAAKVIVPEQRDGEVHYSFAHELIRQTLLSGLSLLRRQRLHLAIADAIERTDPTAADHASVGDRAPPAAGRCGCRYRTHARLPRTHRRPRVGGGRVRRGAAGDRRRAVARRRRRTGRRAKLLERKGWAVRALGHFEECLAIWDDVLPVYEQTGDVEPPPSCAGRWGTSSSG